MTTVLRPDQLPAAGTPTYTDPIVLGQDPGSVWDAYKETRLILMRFAGGATVASASTIDLGAQASKYFTITGSTSITSFGTTTNLECELLLQDGLTLAHGAGLVVPWGADLVLGAGAVVRLRSNNAGVFYVTGALSADGKAFVPPTIAEVSDSTYLGQHLVNDNTINSVSFWSIGVVIDVLAAPPVSPSNGDKYLVASAGTSGVFIGNENSGAWYVGGIWLFFPPSIGRQLFIQSNQTVLKYLPSAVWQRRNSRFTYVSDFNTLAAADTFNVASGRLLMLDADAVLAGTTTLASTQIKPAGGTIDLAANALTISALGAVFDTNRQWLKDTVGGGTVSFSGRAINWRETGATGDGTTDDRAAIALADSIGQTKAFVGNYAVATDLTITNQVTLGAGAKISPASTKTVTFSDFVQLPRFTQVFGTAGAVLFSKAQEHDIEHWGTDTQVFFRAMPATAAGCTIWVRNQMTVDGCDMICPRDKCKAILPIGAAPSRNSSTGIAARLFLSNSAPLRTTLIPLTGGGTVGYLNRNVVNIVGDGGKDEIKWGLSVWGNKGNNASWGTTPYLTTSDGYPSHGIFIMDALDTKLSGRVLAESCCDQGIRFEIGTSGAGFASNGCFLEDTYSSSNYGHGLDLGGFADAQAVVVTVAANGDKTKSGVAAYYMRDQGAYTDTTGLIATVAGGGGSGATANPIVTSNGDGTYRVTGIIPTANGTGYTSTPTVTLSGAAGTTRAAAAFCMVPQLSDGINHTSGNVEFAEIRGFLNAHNTVSCYGSNFRASLVHGNSCGGAAVEITGDHNQIASIYGYENGTNIANLALNGAGSCTYIHANADNNWIGSVVGNDAQGTPTQYMTLYMSGTGGGNYVGAISQEGGVNALNTTGQAFSCTMSGGSNYVGILGAQTVAYNAASWDPVNGNALQIALTGNGSLVNPPAGSLVEGQAYSIALTQDATGGRTFSFGTSFTIISSVDTASNALTLLSCIVNNGKIVEIARPLKGGLGWYISGGGGVITTGLKDGLSIPYGGVIKGVAMFSSTSCSAVVEVWKKNNAIPTVSDKISASAPLTLSAGQVYTDTTLTGWTTTVTADDVFYFNVTSVSGASGLSIRIDMLRNHN